MTSARFMTSVYNINKGINKPIEFRGLKAQYIWYLGGIIIILLFAFAILYICGVPSVICILFVAIAGSVSILRLYGLSRKYGQYGMMKALAKKSIPKVLKCCSRKVFFSLKK